MERKFISTLFINTAKESGKKYLKGTLKIPAADIPDFLNAQGDLTIPVFGHLKDGVTKTGSSYKAFTLEVIQNEEENSKGNTSFAKKDGKSSKTNSRNEVDLPF